MRSGVVWVREGVENVRRGGILMGALVVIMTIFVAGATVLDARTAQAIIDAEARFLDDGGDLLVAFAGTGRIDAAACERAKELAGVRAAGAVDLGPLATGVVGHPGVSQSIVAVTPGVLGLFGDRGPRVPPVPVTLASDEVIVAPAVAERWAWKAGTTLQLTGGEVAGLALPEEALRVAAVADLELIDDAASTSVLVIRPATGWAGACYVRVDPRYRADVAAGLPFFLGESRSSPVSVADRLPEGGGTTDPATAVDERATRWIGAAAGVMMGLLWGIVAWMRRSRTALYATIGVSRSSSFLIRWTEAAGVLLAGSLWGGAFGISAAVAMGCTPAHAVVWAGTTAVVALGTGMLLATAVTLWRPATLAALKDR
jgi:hypothetical protein